MTDLERAAETLELAGWTVTRPAFDDPYEVLYRRMQRAGMLEDDPHPDDDPTSPSYEWGLWNAAELRFLKDHFVIRDPAT